MITTGKINKKRGRGRPREKIMDNLMLLYNKKLLTELMEKNLWS